MKNQNQRNFVHQCIIAGQIKLIQFEFEGCRKVICLLECQPKAILSPFCQSLKPMKGNFVVKGDFDPLGFSLIQRKNFYGSVIAINSLPLCRLCRDVFGNS